MQNSKIDDTTNKIDFSILRGSITEARAHGKRVPIAKAPSASTEGTWTEGAWDDAVTRSWHQYTVSVRVGL